MSSSVFIESSSSMPDKIGELEQLASAADSNLVVVYGKNGVNFDRKGLENLIEEKTLASISVIRLTSPTPSMENEEDEVEKLEELLRRQNMGTDEEAEENSGKETETEEDRGNKASDVEEIESNENGSKESLSDSADDTTESSETAKIKRQKKRLTRNSNLKIQKIKRKQKKDRPDIVGLTVEQFYPPKDAKELAKEILRMAGISTIKHTADHEFQMYVIKNDHCYTPFTSPIQMKAKLAAEKLEAEKQQTSARKILPQCSVAISKQLLTKKRLQQPINTETVEENKQAPSNVSKIRSERQQNSSNSTELTEDDDEINTSNADDFDEDTDLSNSEISAETDNDRDSDLDFNLSNRKGRKRRVKLQKKLKRMHNASKMQNRRRHYSQGDSNDAKTPPPLTLPATQRTKAFGSVNSDLGRINKSLSTQSVKEPPVVAIGLSKSLSDAIAALPPIPKKLTSVESKAPSSSIQQTIIANTIRRGPIVQIRTPNAIRKDQLQSTSQSIKEIVINKVMASPKGGFTDISALLTKADSSIIATPTTPKSSIRAPCHSTPICKGFTPLGIESAIKNELPSQISIQTHQSTSELAAEQFDLLDSIMQDEMQKSGIIEQTPRVHEEIPELVKMLKNSVNVLASEQRSKAQMNNFTPANTVENIDISSATLLDANEDEIPDDLLQHVEQLIGDEKTLQEAIDTQVFGEETEMVSCATSNAVTPAGTPLKHQPNVSGSNIDALELQQINDTETPSKSIIQLTLSNETITPQVPVNANQMLENQTPKTAITIHTAPIKIVRGNGRVITLPPIEAPTTRAKRRAQVHPTHQQILNVSSLINESSIDSSIQSNASFSYTDASLTEKKPTDTDVRVGVPKEGTTTPTAVSGKSVKRSATGKKAPLTKTSSSNTSNSEAEAVKSREDDDDPNKLWCICRQPHNNRFMICCDVCEDWFHGSCVNITKALGLEMEQKGTDWTCPKCVKKLEEKKQRKITDMLVVKKPPSTPDLQLPLKETVEKQLPLEVDIIPQQQKKQHIDIKKIQTCQFITLKNLENPTKFPITIVTSDQKKLFAAATNVKTNSIITTPQGKRAVVPNVPEVKKPKTTTVIKTQTQVLYPCIMCKKAARKNAIYCSDECIRKYANSYLTKTPDSKPTNIQSKSAEDKKKKSKGLFEDLLLLADQKPKAERVNVYERKSGRVLIGNNAPTTLNLKKWLQDNPTFEVVQPGSTKAIEIEKRNKQRSSLPNLFIGQSNPNSPVVSPNTNLSLTPQATTSTQASKTEDNCQSEISKPVKLFVDPAKQSSNLRTPTPQQKILIKSEKITKTEVKDDKKSKEKVIKRLSNENADKKSESGDDLIRENVRRTLKEQLIKRIEEQRNSIELSQSDDSPPQLNMDEVDKFVKETELEMYNYFNRDAGAKYKAKYRSLMFNIKDRKNHTLFAKISAKLVEPKQLVRMSPEELASQELAQWREKEAKHQLEMIKKSELDLLSCAKNYVLKTHKGEEVIEGKSMDCVNLDITTPVEDVVSVLNNDSAVSSETADGNLSASRREHLLEASFLKSVDEKIKVENPKLEKPSKEKEKIRRSAERDRRHKSKDHHREKTKSRKRSRTHSRTRSRSKEKKHKSFHKDEREREHEKYKVPKIARDKESIREKELKEDVIKKPVQKKPHSTAIKDNHKNESSGSITRKLQISKPLEPFSLIDQILESSKTMEEAANLVPDVENVTERETNKPTSLIRSMSTKQPPQETMLVSEETSTSVISLHHEFSDSDADVKITDDATASRNPYFKYFDANSVLSQTTLWEGNINMIDLTSFQLLMQPVVGNAVNLGKLMRAELDVVGRIGPDTVLDYVSKIKRSPNKEIVIVRFIPASSSETLAYTMLYDYLDQRKRMGVIKTTSSQIKDFYIFPLGAKQQMPSILQPLEHVSFYEDFSRPNVLLGIVIRVIGKRISNAPNLVPTSMVVSSTTQFSRRSNENDTNTPPGSPKRTKRSKEIDIDAIIKGPMTAKINKPSLTTTTSVDDADEPYSPGGSTDDDVSSSVPVMPMTVSESLQIPGDDLKQKMDDINRQIAAQEREIAGLLRVDSSYNPSAHSASSTVLANISIPSNLSQILASIKSKPPELAEAIAPKPFTGTLMSTKQEHSDEEYNPEDTYKTSSYSKLKHLSEAELLSMVPDDMIQKPTTADNKPSRCDDQPPPPGV